ncbi:uncharacterized protein MONOS_4720 [Monocercomonoides exilis]|uniref:uncharacterized protein n=1 Tax=Monocercomonoides exilis TaxID=2049356 RepID=UPI003559E065|nr:hypothetical protein MONOS_4720 [Monocercomonoides exilis]|eukprot:MONOS_4720.1-p1 / transcript=MONOS_4720.1 / gene=MONOS_4720 / organism=Monocercomonoides_exilis_PA203 / gene_product=unspecified product / transcript_product=unspecified product / location=Mono_scaffold00129:23551-27659(+) / protein_length=1270 / sequence_SO=supercontig / SO=protein_coding / is_pseudo=false
MPRIICAAVSSNAQGAFPVVFPRSTPKKKIVEKTLIFAEPSEKIEPIVTQSDILDYLSERIYHPQSPKLDLFEDAYIVHAAYLEVFDNICYNIFDSLHPILNCTPPRPPSSEATCYRPASTEKSLKSKYARPSSVQTTFYSSNQTGLEKDEESEKTTQHAKGFHFTSPALPQLQLINPLSILDPSSVLLLKPPSQYHGSSSTFQLPQTAPAINREDYNSFRQQSNSPFQPSSVSPSGERYTRSVSPQAKNRPTSPLPSIFTLPLSPVRLAPSSFSPPASPSRISSVTPSATSPFLPQPPLSKHAASEMPSLSHRLSVAKLQPQQQDPSMQKTYSSSSSSSPQNSQPPDSATAQEPDVDKPSTSQSVDDFSASDAPAPAQSFTATVVDAVKQSLSAAGMLSSRGLDSEAEECDGIHQSEYSSVGSTITSVTSSGGVTVPAPVLALRQAFDIKSRSAVLCPSADSTGGAMPLPPALRISPLSVEDEEEEEEEELFPADGSYMTQQSENGEIRRSREFGMSSPMHRKQVAALFSNSPFVFDHVKPSSPPFGASGGYRDGDELEPPERGGSSRSTPTSAMNYGKSSRSARQEALMKEYSSLNDRLWHVFTTAEALKSSIAAGEAQRLCVEGEAARTAHKLFALRVECEEAGHRKQVLMGLGSSGGGDGTLPISGGNGSGGRRMHNQTGGKTGVGSGGGEKSDLDDDMNERRERENTGERSVDNSASGMSGRGSHLRGSYSDGTGGVEQGYGYSVASIVVAFVSREDLFEVGERVGRNAGLSYLTSLLSAEGDALKEMALAAQRGLNKGNYSHSHSHPSQRSPSPYSSSSASASSSHDSIGGSSDGIEINPMINPALPSGQNVASFGVALGILPWHQSPLQQLLAHALTPGGNSFASFFCHYETSPLKSLKAGITSSGIEDREKRELYLEEDEDCEADAEVLAEFAKAATGIPLRPQHNTIEEGESRLCVLVENARELYRQIVSHLAHLRSIVDSVPAEEYTTFIAKQPVNPLLFVQMKKKKLTDELSKRKEIREKKRALRSSDTFRIHSGERNEFWDETVLRREEEADALELKEKMALFDEQTEAIETQLQERDAVLQPILQRAAQEAALSPPLFNSLCRRAALLRQGYRRHSSVLITAVPRFIEITFAEIVLHPVVKKEIDEFCRTTLLLLEKIREQISLRLKVIVEAHRLKQIGWTADDIPSADTSNEKNELHTGLSSTSAPSTAQSTNRKSQSKEKVGKELRKSEVRTSSETKPKKKTEKVSAQSKKKSS